MIVSCKWPELAEDDWLDKQVEVCARDVQTGEDLHAFMQNTAISLSNFLDRVAQDFSYQLLVVNPFARNNWTRRNAVWGGKLAVDPDTTQVMWPAGQSPKH